MIAWHTYTSQPIAALFQWLLHLEGGGRNYSQKSRVGGVCSSSQIFHPTYDQNLIYDLAKIGQPIYNRCGWHSCPKHMLGKAFDGGLIDNDEKVLTHSCRSLSRFP